MPRVKIFAWRACKEALSTQSGLHRRVASIDPACGVCGAAEEVGTHAISMCALARSVWEISGLECEMSRGCFTVADWWGCVFKTLDDDELALFLTICWAVWDAWCKGVIEREFTSPEATLNYAKKVHLELHETSVVPHPSTWQPLDVGWVKVDSDAGL